MKMLTCYQWCIEGARSRPSLKCVNNGWLGPHELTVNKILFVTEINEWVSIIFFDEWNKKMILPVVRKGIRIAANLVAAVTRQQLGLKTIQLLTSLFMTALKMSEEKKYVWTVNGKQGLNEQLIIRPGQAWGALAYYYISSTYMWFMNEWHWGKLTTMSEASWWIWTLPRLSAARINEPTTYVCSEIGKKNERTSINWEKFLGCVYFVSWLCFFFSFRCGQTQNDKTEIKFHCSMSKNVSVSVFV